MNAGVTCYHGADECPDKCMCPCDPCYLVRTDAYTGDALDPLAVTGAHQCDYRCRCPVHGTPLIYWPAGDDHACQDVTCEYGHGGAG